MTARLDSRLLVGGNTVSFITEVEEFRETVDIHSL